MAHMVHMETLQIGDINLTDVTLHTHPHMQDLTMVKGTITGTNKHIKTMIPNERIPSWNT